MEGSTRARNRHPFHPWLAHSRPDGSRTAHDPSGTRAACGQTGWYGNQRGRMSAATRIEDLKHLYRGRVSRAFYDHVEGGSRSERTFAGNGADFARSRLRQRVAVDVSARTTSSRLIGRDVAMPVALAPVGRAGFRNAEGRSRRRGRRKVWRPFHIVDQVDSFHRRRRAAQRRAIPVSATAARERSRHDGRHIPDRCA